MLYYIDGKCYILASNKYHEVVVKKDKKEYNVEVVKDAKKIPYVHNVQKPQISLEEAYKNSNKITNN
jgi:hypothetical protein